MKVNIFPHSSPVYITFPLAINGDDSQSTGSPKASFQTLDSYVDTAARNYSDVVDATILHELSSRSKS